MTVSVTVTTSDTSPTAAPHKLSLQPGFTTAQIDFDVTGDGPVRAYRLVRGGTAIINGTPLAAVGGVTGLTRCGAPDAKAVAIPTPHEFTEPIDADELGPGDGDYAINLYVYNGEVFE